MRYGDVMCGGGGGGSGVWRGSTTRVCLFARQEYVRSDIFKSLTGQNIISFRGGV